VSQHQETSASDQSGVFGEVGAAVKCGRRKIFWRKKVGEIRARRRPFGPDAARRLMVSGAVQRVKLEYESRDGGDRCVWRARDVAGACDWLEVT
jgi:hypothetical protein